MQPAKFFSIFIAIVLSAYGGISFYFLPSASFDGDLTRMGMLPESLFGWTKEQPAVAQSILRQASIQEADVYVIGDSFSDGLIWQSVLNKAGLKVRTEHWKDIGSAICEDIAPWLRSRGFSGKYIVLQSIERQIDNRTNQSIACSTMPRHLSSKSEAPRPPPKLNLDISHEHYAGRLSTRFKILLNIWEYHRLSKTKGFETWSLPNNVKMARIENGCELFSHPQCKDSLFLAEDSPEELNKDVFERIKTLNKRFDGITPIWAFVPNKSTAYLYPNKRFWDAAEQHFLAPNLLRMSRHAIQRGTVDLYPANNTHFSTTGYLLMGEEIWRAMQMEAR